MPQFWWVNHNQTARQEIEGQYLWSPKTESNGARSEFYNNMRRASPGDFVLSFFEQAIRYVGRVTEFAFTAPKPAEFKEAGSYWNKEGWLLPVFWTQLDPPVRPKALIEVLGPLLPTKYSPINPTSGSGNQKAYLANISPAVFQTIVDGAISTTLLWSAAVPTASLSRSSMNNSKTLSSGRSKMISALMIRSKKASFWLAADKAGSGRMLRWWSGRAASQV
jgi:hypothetical protein